MTEISDTKSDGGGAPIPPVVLVPADQMEAFASLIVTQLQGLTKTVVEDVMKGNFSGAWGDVKAQAINDGITDAIQATRVIEQQLMTHIAGLGNSKQLDIAKGKISDAFIWIEKHLGIGG